MKKNSTFTSPGRIRVSYTIQPSTRQRYNDMYEKVKQTENPLYMTIMLSKSQFVDIAINSMLEAWEEKMKKGEI